MTKQSAGVNRQEFPSLTFFTGLCEVRHYRQTELLYIVLLLFIYL